MARERERENQKLNQTQKGTTLEAPGRRSRRLPGHELLRVGSRYLALPGRPVGCLPCHFLGNKIRLPKRAPSVNKPRRKPRHPEMVPPFTEPVSFNPGPLQAARNVSVAHFTALEPKRQAEYAPSSCSHKRQNQLLLRGYVSFYLLKLRSQAFERIANRANSAS